MYDGIFPEFFCDCYEHDSSDFTKIKRIVGQCSAASFGEVFHVKDSYGNEFIQKMMMGENANKPFLRHSRIFMKMFDHPSILNYKGFTKNPPSILFEYPKNGNLQDVLKKLRNHESVKEYNDTTRAKLVFGFAAALVHFHLADVVHRALSPVCLYFDENYEIKIGDFEFAKLSSESETNTLIHTDPRYTSPDVSPTSDFLQSQDIFSFGMILWEVVTGKEPFSGKNSKDIKRLIKYNQARESIPLEADKLLQDLIQNSWDPDPEKRPESKLILANLYAYSEPIFPNVDMSEYKKYQDRILKETHLSIQDRVIITSLRTVDENETEFKEMKDKADSTGDPEAEFHVAQAYETGNGVFPDMNKAFNYYKKASKQNHPIAKFKLALMLSTGSANDKVDFAKSNKLLKESHELGYKEASLLYARRLEQGIATVPDRSSAIKILRKLASPPMNDAYAMYELGRILYKENATSKEGVMYFLKAKQQGNILALLDYAKALIEGKGIPKNVEEGIKIYKQLSNLQVPTAKYNLGNIYEKNNKLSKAVKYYREAAELKHPRGMSKFGYILMKGAMGVQKNIKEAYRLFQESAMKGDSLGCHLYALFLKEHLIEEDHEKDSLKAIKFFEAAGHAESYFHIGQIYSFNNKTKAKEYFKKAAELGSKRAKNQLSKI